MLIANPIDELKEFLKGVKKWDPILELVYTYPPVVQYNIIKTTKNDSYKGTEATICKYHPKSKRGIFECHVYSSTPYWRLLPGTQFFRAIALEVKEAQRDIVREVRKYMIENDMISPWFLKNFS